VLAALARDADSPMFYDDVKRYWSSLDDATGPDILFVLAGANSAKELKEEGISASTKGKSLYNDSMAVAGEKKRFIDLSLWTYGMSKLNEETVEQDQTQEIGGLRRFLGLQESQIPCLLFTILKTQAGIKYKNIIVPFSVLNQVTIYQFLKAISEKLEDEFKEIDEIHSLIEMKERSKNYIEKPLRKIFNMRQRIASGTENITRPEAKQAVAKILSITGAPGRLKENQLQCFEYLQIARKNLYVKSFMFGLIKRLIELSFEDSIRNVSFDQQNVFIDVEKIASEIENLQKNEAGVWERIESVLRSYEDYVKAENNSNWDYFIAYSSPNRMIAEKIFIELSKTSRVFLDTRCLKPGDHWTERIRSAQNNSKCTVLVITKETPNSWFAESEYLYTINLAREKKQVNHGIIPVLYGKDAKLPYGLEQIHAATLQSFKDIENLPRLIGQVA
jgi:hypothetical protein